MEILKYASSVLQRYAIIDFSKLLAYDKYKVHIKIVVFYLFY